MAETRSLFANTCQQGEMLAAQKGRENAILDAVEKGF